eukprot:jgi/Tetstr1/425360/TSEL_015808.t1
MGGPRSQETDMDVNLDIDLPAPLLISDRKATEGLLAAIQVQVKDLINTLANKDAAAPGASGKKDRNGAGEDQELTEYDTREPFRGEIRAATGGAEAASDGIQYREEPSPISPSSGTASSAADPLRNLPSDRPSHPSQVDATGQIIHIRERLHSHHQQTTEAGPVQVDALGAYLDGGAPSGGTPSGSMASRLSLLDAQWVASLSARSARGAPRWLLPSCLFVAVLLAGVASLCCCGCLDVNHLKDLREAQADADEPPSQHGRMADDDFQLHARIKQHAVSPEDCTTLNSPRVAGLNFEMAPKYNLPRGKPRPSKK